jgi:hypothetical protein
MGVHLALNRPRLDHRLAARIHMHMLDPDTQTRPLDGRSPAAPAPHACDHRLAAFIHMHTSTPDNLRAAVPQAP